MTFEEMSVMAVTKSFYIEIAFVTAIGDIFTHVTAIGDLSQMSVMAVILGHYVVGTFLTAITDLFKITFYMKYHQ